MSHLATMLLYAPERAGEKIASSLESLNLVRPILNVLATTEKPASKYDPKYRETLTNRISVYINLVKNRTEYHDLMHGLNHDRDDTSGIALFLAESVDIWHPYIIQS